MPRTLLIILVAIGLCLPGCSLQKRSIMPGWHVEKPQQKGANRGAVAEHKSKQAVPNASPSAPLRIASSSQPEALTHRKNSDPVIPVKSLMSYSPPVKIAQEKQLMQTFPPPVTWAFPGILLNCLRPIQHKHTGSGVYGSCGERCGGEFWASLASALETPGSS